jgi:hypothetical protein
MRAEIAACELNDPSMATDLSEICIYLMQAHEGSVSGRDRPRAALRIRAYPRMMQIDGDTAKP